MSKTYSAGIVTAYGAAKRAGYQGTYEDFCRQQAGYAGCLENPRDGGAWWAAVYGVAQSQTQLKRLSSSSKIIITLE